MYKECEDNLFVCKNNLMESIKKEGPIQTGYLMETVCKLIDKILVHDKKINDKKTDWKIVINDKCIKNLDVMIKGLHESIDENKPLDIPFSIFFMSDILKSLIDGFLKHEETINNFIKNAKTENVIADAMNVLITALKEDKEPGSYYHGWMCNLACKIFDNCSNKLSMEECNTIATKWLDFLISIPRNETKVKE